MDSTLVQQLEQTGIDLLNFGKQSAQQFYKFIEAEAPQLLQEWLSWNFAISLIVTIISFLILTANIITIFKAKANDWKVVGDWEGLLIFAWVLGIVVPCVFIYSHIDWLQIWMAPRVWILENIKHLIGG